MLSSLNSFGGLSAAEIVTLFGANSSSAQAGATVANSSPSSSSQVSASSNTAMNAIQAILAQSQIDHAKLEASLGGSTSTATVQAAYAEQADGADSVTTASVTISTPGAVQQINDAVSFINEHGWFRTVDPITTVLDPIDVTAADAVNVTMSNGSISLTATQGAAFTNGLPSSASIQQALDQLKADDESTGWNGFDGCPETTAKETADTWWNGLDGSLTLVKIPADVWGNVNGGNIISFGEGDNHWAVVLPQETISVATSDIQANS